MFCYCCINFSWVNNMIWLLVVDLYFDGKIWGDILIIIRVIWIFFILSIGYFVIYFLGWVNIYNMYVYCSKFVRLLLYLTEKVVLV